ncbi:NAD(P)-binding protein [Cadophora sp. DSE1049]|nr:NAD(P)-binding protein [Cadophora sp. DSE1049]
MSSSDASAPAGYPVFTKRWHNKPYSTISPTRPENSARGKVIVVTGGGTGIGAAIAKSFAEAGAAGIGLIGRREEQLKSSSRSISSISNTTKVEYATADVTDKNSLDKAFGQFAERLGKIDILVSNAGYFSKADLSSADGDDWWRSFEVNVKGSFNTIQAFIPHAKLDAAVLSVNAALAHMQPALPGISSYIVSKLASARLHECLQVEHPKLRVVSVQPGVVESAMTEKFGASGMDDRKLLSPDLRDFTLTISS